MPMIKVRGISKEEVIKESSKLIDLLVEIIECPRDYFSIELINNTFIMDGEVTDAPSIIEVEWFDRGQEVQDKVAKTITEYFKKDRECLDVVFKSLECKNYYENGKHF
ncbi:DUF1904 family protein [Clostridium niameyense]|uniref:DUF1904 family protein n=1 Tax=Clostridium niameyense TaxID=1622073 RepID=A0A6M0RD94_9CLOT|nr:DUF1904 family protein [Clostridium niameyense]NEZ47760.1 DUF1904 family protein [Clostridium niameyense]